LTGLPSVNYGESFSFSHGLSASLILPAIMVVSSLVVFLLFSFFRQLWCRSFSFSCGLSASLLLAIMMACIGSFSFSCGLSASFIFLAIIVVLNLLTSLVIFLLLFFW
ncbi:23507_t:CDS:2, partial [Cetraspora pellucida]